MNEYLKLYSVNSLTYTYVHYNDMFSENISKIRQILNNENCRNSS